MIAVMPGFRSLSVSLSFLLSLSLLVMVCAACNSGAPDGAIGAIDASTPAAPDADAAVDITDAAVRPKKMIVIKGQSNAVGHGLASDVASDPRMQPLPDVRYLAQVGDNSDPPKIDAYAWGDLRSLTYRSGLDSFGIEISLGHALHEAEPGTDWYIAKFAYGATSLFYNWAPGGAYPTSPASAPNLFEQGVAFEQRAIADTGAPIVAEIWIQGESDADTDAHAQAYQGELLSFVAAEQAAFPAFASQATPLYFGELINAHWAARTALRASQVADQSQFAILINQDGLPLADGMHFTAQSYLDLGERYASAILVGQH